MVCVPDFASRVCLVGFLSRAGTTTCSSGPRDGDTESENLSRLQKILELSSGSCRVASGDESKEFISSRPRPAVCGVLSPLGGLVRLYPGPENKGAGSVC